MNIFFLSYNPRLAAQYQYDKHVIKMVLESAQMLSTAHRVLDGQEYYDYNPVTNRRIKRWSHPEPGLYKATHVNHPSCKWVRESTVHYLWLYDHFVALLNEYTFRFGKTHKCTSLVGILKKLPINIEGRKFVPPPSAMNKKYVVSQHSTLSNYRHYYQTGKAHLYKYTHREPPEWMDIMGT